MPQSLLFRGPEGVGKQRLALWTAELLLCQEGEACGRCRSCRLAERLEHPDLHWHFPLPRPKGVPRHKLREKLEEARSEALEHRRRFPLRPEPVAGPTGIYLAAVEEMRVQASRRPAMGNRAVFVVGDAEQMVPQAANPEAANAFLKLLEEPSPHISLIVTSSRPGALLSTIRSRTLAVRVPPLDREDVDRFLREEAGMSAEEAVRVAPRAQGSIGRALRIAAGLESGERAIAEGMLKAALSPRASEALRQAARLSSVGARGEFAGALRTLAELLRDLLGLSLGQEDLAFEAEVIRELVGARLPAPEGVAEALGHVEEALEEAAGNVNPQAIAATLLLELRGALAAA